MTKHLEYYKNLSLEPIKYYDLEGNLCIEEWRDIPKYEGLYQGSDCGRIKSLKKTRLRNGCVPTAIYSERILKPTLCKYGYCHVSLYRDSIYKLKRVHRLIAEVFIPNPKNLPEVNHIDLIKTNCYVWNLEWMTERRNCIHYRLTQKTSSKYTGVSWDSKIKKWKSCIQFCRKTIHLGYFDDELEAHEAYQKALKEIDEGEFTPPQKRIKNLC